MKCSYPSNNFIEKTLQILLLLCVNFVQILEICSVYVLFISCDVNGRKLMSM